MSRKNDKKEGDAAQSGGPGQCSKSSAEAASGLSANVPIATLADDPFGWAPPGKCVCDLCGGAYVVNNWADYSRFCPEHEYMSKQFMLQATIDAHGVFVKGGCDMYGSQAHPDLDKGWLDGYAAGRYDSRIERWKEERERVSGSEGANAVSSSSDEGGERSEANPVDTRPDQREGDAIIN